VNLAAGTQLGPYEIVAPIGAGGMGEVYRARDSRLAREVAVKTVSGALRGNPDRLARFEQEARAAARLNHPNILAVHDIGNHEGVPFVVSELLEGETLADRLQQGGPMPTRKVLEYAMQITAGLAAAHEKGIVHRDLKPDNLFITRDGRIKILDFGLAKLTQPQSSEHDAQAATLLDRTQPGAIMGTNGYMSPEQVRGLPVDPRADLFSLGVILFEMLLGANPFRRDTAVDTMSAIVRDDPPELATTLRNVPPALERVLRHLCEKRPELRFQSARDLLFDLETLQAMTPMSTTGPFTRIDPPRRVWPLAIVALVIAVAAAAGMVALTRGSPAPTAPSAPGFHRLTFRHGRVYNARFSPDGNTILYSAAWEGGPLELFSMRPENPESSPLPFESTDLLAVSENGEMALALHLKVQLGWVQRGTLARSPLVAGAPREILEDVEAADFGPAGEMAAVRSVGGKTRLEYPIGHPIYETTGWISHPRVSRDGQSIAFLHHPDIDDDHGDVAVIGAQGGVRILTEDFSTAQGLAWSPKGDEIWYTAAEKGAARALRAVTIDGRKRLFLRTPGELTLQDVSRDGRVLLTREEWWRRIIGRGAGDAREHDLSWLDWSNPVALSSDGKSLLFYEQGEGGGASHGVYLRKTDASAAVKLGDGLPFALSPDGKWVLSVPFDARDRLFLVPTGVGSARPIPGVPPVSAASFHTDGRHILFVSGGRTWSMPIEGADKPKPITPEGTTGTRASPDGHWLVAADKDGKTILFPLAGDAPRAVPGLGSDETVIAWRADSRALYVTRVGEVPAKVSVLDIATGKREPWKDIQPVDAAGVTYVSPIIVAPDGKSYAYGYRRILSDLYLVDGLR